MGSHCSREKCEAAEIFGADAPIDRGRGDNSARSAPRSWRSWRAEAPEAGGDKSGDRPGTRGQRERRVLSSLSLILVEPSRQEGGGHRKLWAVAQGTGPVPLFLCAQLMRGGGSSAEVVQLGDRRLARCSISGYVALAHCCAVSGVGWSSCTRPSGLLAALGPGARSRISARKGVSPLPGNNRPRAGVCIVTPRCVELASRMRISRCRAHLVADPR